MNPEPRAEHVMHKTPEELHAMCQKLYEDAQEPQTGAYYPLYLLAEFAHSLIDELEIMQEEQKEEECKLDQAAAALKQAKKTLKITLKTMLNLQKEDSNP